MLRSLTTPLLLIGLATSALAQHAPPPVGGMEAAVFVEKWGEVLFCQEAYRHPLNRERVYEFDTTQCNAAATHFAAQLAGFDEPTRQHFSNAARQRARVIRANTRDIAWVVTACRETCQEVAEKAAPTTPDSTSEPSD